MGKWHTFQGDITNPLGLAKRCLLGDGLIVPAEEADEVDEADEESSSCADSGSGFKSSIPSSSSSSSSWLCGSGGSKGRFASLALAKDRWRWLIVLLNRKREAERWYWRMEYFEGHMFIRECSRMNDLEPDSRLWQVQIYTEKTSGHSV